VEGERIVAGLWCREVLADLSEFLDGGLAAGRRAQIEAHVRECVTCERFGGRFSEAVRLLRRHLAEPAPLAADAAERLRARLRRELG
jgi:anti-sigma factor RsiW